MRVLVIEDEPDLCRILVGALRENGYAVDEAPDGESGLTQALAWDHDALVLDLMLPRLSGWDVLTKLRRHKKTPVLILTARDAINDRVRGLDCGGDDYLVKPFALNELLARLRALIRRAAGGTSARIEIGNVVIDQSSRAIYLDGEEVTLTAREYALVELLALHRGRLITRTMIYEHLFDESEDSLSNLVDVHVCNVRRKLGKDFITTRRGQGYLIDG